MCDEFVDRVMMSHIKHHNLQKRHIFVDSAPCHKTDALNHKFKSNGINPHFIPPRFTSLLQPADVAWFSALKRKLHSKWTEWYINEEKTFTKSNHMRSPGYAKLITWISDIWHETNDITQFRSFRYYQPKPNVKRTSNRCRRRNDVRICG
jgi:hypothetical protein